MSTTMTTASIADEFREAPFGDQRLSKRLETLAEELGNHPGDPISLAAGDWAAAKAAYRFLDNVRVTPERIQAPHVEATRARIEALGSETVLVLHDTSELNYTRYHGVEGLGYLTCYKTPNPEKVGMVQGILLHTSVASTVDGVPLGLLNQKIWTRDLANYRRVRRQGKNFTRVPIEKKESMRWLDGVTRATELVEDSSRLVHICDRDGDIFELFELCEGLGTNFVIRVSRDRNLDDSSDLLFDHVDEARAAGYFIIDVQGTADRPARRAAVLVRFQAVRIKPSVSKGQRCDPVDLYLISATEPQGRGSRVEHPIEWRLLTNIEVNSFADALEKIYWYQRRWAIETFHKVLKSGCRVEHCRLRHGDRLKNYAAFMSVVAWRIFWLTTISRRAPTAEPSICFAEPERAALLALDRRKSRHYLHADATLQDFKLAVARLGGYFGRRSDGDPGPLTIWRGMLRLNDITLGYCASEARCGYQ